MKQEKKLSQENTNTDRQLDLYLDCNQEKKDKSSYDQEQILREYNGDLHNLGHSYKNYSYEFNLYNSGFHSHKDRLYRKQQSQKNERLIENRTAYFEKDTIKMRDELKPYNFHIYCKGLLDQHFKHFDELVKTIVKSYSFLVKNRAIVTINNKKLTNQELENLYNKYSKK